MKKKPQQPKVDDEDQSKLFIEKAREIETDEKASKADALMGKLAKIKPDPRNRPKDR